MAIRLYSDNSENDDKNLEIHDFNYSYWKAEPI